MRALASKSLKASRDNRNRWQIELADLEEWAALLPFRLKVWMFAN